MTYQSTSEPQTSDRSESSSEKFASMTQGILTSLYDDELLSTCYRKIEAKAIEDSTDKEEMIKEGIKELMAGLETKRSQSSDLEWNDFVRYCLKHPIAKLIHQDPFTGRAFSKPRGYAGDAELMDIIYGNEQGRRHLRDVSEVGRGLFAHTWFVDACAGVRKRCCLIAEIVNRLTSEISQPEILSVAAGHLREAELTDALEQRRIGRWVAFDSDVESLQEVQRCYADNGVVTVPGTIRQLLGRKAKLGKFDFIYSTGLYDYLQQPLGRRLTMRLFEMLKPGGQLVIGNFRTGIGERGYMESYMAWQLVFRSHSEMLDLAVSIDDNEIDEIRLQVDDSRCILFLYLFRSKKEVDC